MAMEPGEGDDSLIWWLLIAMINRYGNREGGVTLSPDDLPSEALSERGSATYRLDACPNDDGTVTFWVTRCDRSR